jgi:aconitate hydratase
MGVIPFTFSGGATWQSLGLKGDEKVTLVGIKDLKPRKIVEAKIVRGDGTTFDAPLICRIDTLDEIEYFKNGGILQYVLRNLAA